MRTDILLVIGYLVWTVVTVGSYIACLLDSQARQQAWRRIALERRRLQQAWWELDRMAYGRGAHRRRERLDDYLRDDSTMRLYLRDY